MRYLIALLLIAGRSSGARYLIIQIIYAGSCVDVLVFHTDSILQTEQMFKMIQGMVMITDGSDKLRRFISANFIKLGGENPTHPL